MFRQQQEVRQQPPLASLTEVDSEYQLSPEEKRTKLSPNIIRRTFMRTSPKLEGQSKIKSPTPLFGKPLFSPRSRARATSQTALNVRRFSTDSVFNSQTLKIDRSSAIGRRLSKDATFLNSSPPDINSRRSSYLDMINSSQKLSGKSPVLSIENVSQASKEVEKLDIVRKYSDAESIGRKLATLPKYKDGINTNRLHPGDRLNLGKSDETLSKSEGYGESLQTNEIAQAKSYQNILDGSKGDLEIDDSACGTLNLTAEQKANLSDDEIARRNKQTIEQLRCQLNIKIESIKPQIKRTTSNTTTMPSHPSIRIEDTSKHEKLCRSLDRPDVTPKDIPRVLPDLAPKREGSRSLERPEVPPKEKKPEVPPKNFRNVEKPDVARFERPDVAQIKPDITRERSPRLEQKMVKSKTLDRPDLSRSRNIDRPDIPPKEKLCRSLDRPDVPKPSRMEKRIEEMCKQERASWTMDKTSWSMDRRMEEASKMEKQARLEKERSFVLDKGEKSRTGERRIKHRHRSLGEAPKSPLPPEPVPPKRNRRVTEHSRYV